MRSSTPEAPQGATALVDDRSRDALHEPTPDGTYAELGLSDAEYDAIVEQLGGRHPNMVELGMFSVLWSEHCSYKSTRFLLRGLPTTGEQVLQGPGENAGVVDIGDGLAVAFKIESHNHPTAVEPFQGAATGVGGIIRDVFTMGARPIALLNSLRFGPITDAAAAPRGLDTTPTPGVECESSHGDVNNRTQPGDGDPGAGDRSRIGTAYGADTATVPVRDAGDLGEGDAQLARNRHLFGGAVEGIAFYGNCVGIPTVGGEVVFDERYRDNPLVNAMCVGLLRHDELATGSARGVGNPVLAVGARTGRDGIHGASFASIEDPLGRERSAVQVGDPFMEKLLLEATLELIASGDVVGIQDMGAAGLTSSSAEMAARVAGAGIELDIDAVPRRESGMGAYELMLSESQERMLVVMKRGREHVADEIFRRWGLEATVVGRVTQDGLLRLVEGGEIVAEVPVASLADGAPLRRLPSREPEYLKLTRAFDLDSVPDVTPGTAGAVLHQLLADPTIASKRWVHQQYDSMVRTSTVVRPGSDAAVVAVHGTDRAIAISTDGNGRYTYLDPRRGGAHAVAEAARNVVCSGARPLAVTNCLNFSTPEDPQVYWQLRESVGGMGDACRALGTPVVSGNVSLYNQTGGWDIYPTPVVGVVGVVKHADRVTTQHWKQPGNHLLLVGATTGATIAGSQYLQTVHDAVAGGAPPLDLGVEAALHKAVLAAIRTGHVASAHDVSDGGVAVALAESAIGGNLGAQIDLAQLESHVGHGADEGAVAPGPKRCEEYDTLLFGECGSRVVLEVAPADIERVRTAVARYGVAMADLGTIGGDELVITRGKTELVRERVESLERSWGEAIECAMT